MANTADEMAPSNLPNVVFIVGDNVGWGDIGCYGGLAPTPRIDQSASEGLRFKNYNVEAQCTPTRSALLTGRLPIRTGTCSVPLPGQGDYGLARCAGVDEGAVTVPQRTRRLGLLVPRVIGRTRL